MLTSFLMKTWGKFNGVLIAVGALFLSLLGAYLKGRSEGRESERDKNRKELLEAINTKKELENEISGLNRSSLTRRLSKWRK